MGVATCLPFFLKFPFFPFALFLKLVVFFNHQHLMLFLDFYLRRLQHHEELGNRFRYPLHIIVHHEVLVTWWQWQENSVNYYLIWKINSHLIQAIAVPRQSEHMLTGWAILLHLVGKVLSEVSYLSTRAWVWNTTFNSWNILYALCRSKCFWSPGSKPWSMVH